MRGQTERSVIITGIVLCLAGVLTVINGICASYRAERFQATAVRTTATVVPTDDPRGALRFQTEQGMIETPLPRGHRGHHEAPGTNLKILYEPDRPQRWTLEPGYDPDAGMDLARIGVVMFIGGPILLTIGWVSRRRSGRPYWQ